MILIIGGQGAGKRRYAMELGFREEDMAFAELDHRPVLVDLHLLLRHGFTGTDVTDDVFAPLLRKDVIICNEVGCGVVPLDAEDRAWRERVGRLCTRLAGRAERVVRVCCGIPLCLKGEDV